VYAATWDVQPDCSLLSAAQTISDGYQQTPVQLRLDGTGLTLLTASNIDFRQPGTGLSVDGGAPLPADRVTDNTHLTFNTAVEKISAQFIAGSHVEVHLYFWPTWPATGGKIARFSLLGFARALKQRQACH